MIPVWIILVVGFVLIGLLAPEFFDDVWGLIIVFGDWWFGVVPAMFADVGVGPLAATVIAAVVLAAIVRALVLR